MGPDDRFTNLDKRFWANVRSISEVLRYTAYRTRQIKTYSIADMTMAMQKLGLESTHIATSDEQPTELGRLLSEYFKFRADVLNNYVEPRLMDAVRAERVFQDLRDQLQPQCPIPMNKQRGEKRAPAFLTGIVNMLIESNARGFPCNFEPRALTTFTKDRRLLRTLARRFDGCFPDTVNPLAVWEIKEYYYTTTFGSRVADAVYESLLDGFELEELRESEGVKVQHLLMLDAHYTWWGLRALLPLPHY